MGQQLRLSWNENRANLNWVVATLVAGVAIRLLIPQPELTGDPKFYREIANSIASGRGLIVSDPMYGTYRALFPPLYPVLLALAGSAFLLGVVIDAAASFALYRLSGSVKAGAAYFLFPTVILSSVVPAKEGLAVLLALACMLTTRPFLYGVLSGLLALTQPAWLVLIVASFVVRFGIKGIAWAALGGALTLLPWWIRNWLLFHQFIPLTSGFWLQMTVAVTGKFLPFASLGSTEMEIIAACKRIAIDAITSDPLGYVARSIRRAFDALFIRPTPIEQVAWLGLLIVVGIKRPKPHRTFLAFVIAAAASIFIQAWMEFGPRHVAYLVPLALWWISTFTPPAARTHESRLR